MALPVPPFLRAPAHRALIMSLYFTVNSPALPSPLSPIRPADKPTAGQSVDAVHASCGSRPPSELGALVEVGYAFRVQLRQVAVAGSLNCFRRNYESSTLASVVDQPVKQRCAQVALTQVRQDHHD